MRAGPPQPGGLQGPGGGRKGARIVQHLGPEEPDVAALDDAVAEGDEAAGEHGKPEGARGVQVLGHAVLLHVVLLQPLFHQRIQHLRTHQQLYSISDYQTSSPARLIGFPHSVPRITPSSLLPLCSSLHSRWEQQASLQGEV